MKSNRGICLLKFSFVFAAIITSFTTYAIVEDLGFHVGGGYGLGTIYSEERTTLPRSVHSVQGFALPGYKIDMFMPGPFFNVQWINQHVKPEKVGNQNMKGFAWELGLGSSISYEEFVILLGVTFIGNYSLSRDTFLGTESDFEKPLGFHAMLSYKVFDYEGFRLAPNLGFEWVRYLQSEEQSKNEIVSESDISTDELRQWAIRLGFAIHY